MRDEDTGFVPVVDNGRPIGVITDRDIVVRAVAEGPADLKRPVREFVTGKPITATPEMNTTEAADLMGRNQVRRLLVCENDRLVGVASIGDLAVKEDKTREVGDTLSEISRGVKER
jgi:CBS domain-containing protein